MIQINVTCILSYVGHANVLTYRGYISNHIINISSIIDSTIFVYDYSITPSLFPESLILSKKHKLLNNFIFYPRNKTVFHHNFIEYTISTFVFKYYVIRFFNAIYLLIIVPFLYFVHHVFHFLFPHLDTCRSKLHMYNKSTTMLLLLAFHIQLFYLK